MQTRIFSFTIGFIILFGVYHFPEFFKPFWIAATFKIGFLLVAYIIARLQGWRGLGGFGLQLANNWFKHLLVGLIIGVIGFSMAIMCSVSLKYEEFQGIQPFFFFIKSLPMVMVMTFFPSLAEDILTRGYLFGHLKHLKPAVWILVSAVIYVLNHIWRINDGVDVTSYLLLLGLVLAVCVIIKRSLWLAFGIHWGANLAYELSASGLHLKTIENSAAPTWCLAAAWGIVLLILVLTRKRQLLKPSNKIN